MSNTKHTSNNCIPCGKKNSGNTVENYFPLTPVRYGEGIYGRTEADTKMECKWCPYKEWVPIDPINYNGFEAETPNSVEKFERNPSKVAEYEGFNIVTKKSDINNFKY